MLVAAPTQQLERGRPLFHFLQFGATDEQPIGLFGVGSARRLFDTATILLTWTEENDSARS